MLLCLWMSLSKFKNFSYFLFVLIAIIVGVIVVKKITGCMIRLVIVSILVGLLAYIYYRFFSA